jgi:hypothetical protein
MGETFEFNVVTRDDVAAIASRTVEEHYLMVDIARNIELNTKNAIIAGKECHIPFFGTFRHNRRHCYWDNIDAIRKAEAELDEVDAINAKKDILAAAVKTHLLERELKAYQSINRNRYPELYKHMVRKKGVEYADLCISMCNLTKYDIPYGETLVNL